MKSAEIKQKEDKIHQKYLLHTQNSQCTEIYTKKTCTKGNKHKNTTDLIGKNKSSCSTEAVNICKQHAQANIH